MAYATYGFYIDSFGGLAIPEADFDRLAERASEYIDSATVNRARVYTDSSNALSKACCSLAEIIWEDEKSSGKSGESVGSWSVSYMSQADREKQKYSILKQYLYPTGLLYTGMR